MFANLNSERTAEKEIFLRDNQFTATVMFKLSSVTSFCLVL